MRTNGGFVAEAWALMCAFGAPATKRLRIKSEFTFEPCFCRARIHLKIYAYRMHKTHADAGETHDTDTNTARRAHATRAVSRDVRGRRTPVGATMVWNRFYHTKKWHTQILANVR